MKRVLWILGLAVCVMAMFHVAGCDKTESPVEPTNEVVVDQSGDDGTQFAFAYPQYSFVLNVPWIRQWPPGNLEGTKNCGQACGVMLGGYFNHGVVGPEIITLENQWLYNYTDDSRFLNPNGYYTGGSYLGAFREMLRQFHALRTCVYYGNDLDDIINEVANGRPVIAGVMIKGGNLVSSNGTPHWVLVVGWDGRIVINDPGSSTGQFRKYTVDAFRSSWATQGKIYIPVFR